MSKQKQKKSKRYKPKKQGLQGLTPSVIFIDEGVYVKPIPKLIKTWDELKECKSETHILEIEDCCGWIHCKLDKGKHAHYLSTHTFYGGTYKNSTKLLQACGFDVELANWDELGW